MRIPNLLRGVQEGFSGREPTARQRGRSARRKKGKVLRLGMTHRWPLNNGPKLRAIEEMEVEESRWSCEVRVDFVEEARKLADGRKWTMVENGGR